MLHETGVALPASRVLRRTLGQATVTSSRPEFGKAETSCQPVHTAKISLCLGHWDRLGLAGLGEQPWLVKTLVYLVLGLLGQS